MPGSWGYIEKRYDEIYLGKSKLNYGTIRKRKEGGAFLDGFNVYDLGEFWHYISFGMSEIYEKESENRDVSGWGYEYSFKLKKGNEDKAPQWVITPLQKLARYVYNQCLPFDEAHFIPFGSAIIPDLNENLNSFIFSFDPIIGVIDTPTGSLKMLEIYCISQKDIDFCFQSELGSYQLIETIRKTNLGFINDFSKSINYSDYV